MAQIPRTAWLSPEAASWLEDHPEVDFDAVVGDALEAIRSSRAPSATKVTRAIILAAGLSPGLERLTVDRPVGMLPVGTQTILDCQIELLRREGVEELALVRGHAADAIGRPGIFYIENPRFREEGPVGSFLAARAWLTKPCLVMYGDVLLSSEALHDLLHAAGSIVLSGETQYREDGRQREWIFAAPNGACGRMTLATESGGASAEFTGLMKLDVPGMDRFIADLAALRNEGGRPETLRFAQALARTIERGGAIRAVLSRDAWLHVDTLEDLEKAWIRALRA